MKNELIYGINPVKEALLGKRRAFELFVARGGQDKRLERITSLAQERGVPIRQREKADLLRLCGTEHHQGVALVMEPFPYGELEDHLEGWQSLTGNGLILVLDGIQDPHNLGALVRSAACAGALGVIIPKDRAAGVTATVEKSSAGAVETIPVIQVTNLAQTIDSLKDAGFWSYGLAGDASATIYSQKLAGKVALVVGGEGEGIRQLVRKKCDVLVSIPLRGGVSSLNASVAGGIAMFEVVRQQSAPLK